MCPISTTVMLGVIFVSVSRSMRDLTDLLMFANSAAIEYRNAKQTDPHTHTHNTYNGAYNI